ncbi:hypothetical protein R6Y99_05755 [Pseudomonas lundensis]|uniref:hypothetical protein n=1 Tax=Serratia proteamaculans TaxID=28151 RepID=UPI0029820730|nr:hypothetical protein [Serratia proteamaculans]MDW5499296.1 hypothetical protein [Serratia proteamaculans]MDW5504358.1 hypothetical protein [Pseudomonas lundensis]
MKGSLSIVLATPAEGQRIFADPPAGSRFVGPKGIFGDDVTFSSNGALLASKNREMDTGNGNL